MMDGRSAFEQQLAREISQMAGPEPTVDTMSVVRSAATGASGSRWAVTIRRFRGDAAVAPRKGGFSMFSAVKFVAAAAIVALFGGFLLSGTLTTQQGEEIAPAAVSASPSPSVIYESPKSVTGEMDAGQTFQASTITQGVDRKMNRGSGYEATLAMDDSRLTGTMYVVRNRDDIGERYQHHDGEVWTGTLELVNEDGSWIGTVRGYTSMNPATLHWHMELTGTGEHEGLSVLLEAEGPYGRWDVEGFVFPGVLPEYPDPVEVPAE